MRKLTAGLIICSFALSGCTSFGMSLKRMLGGDRRPASSKSGKGKVGKIGKKKYRKMTRKTMAEESELGEDSGSLWISRGQGSYLFAQNTNRLIGDLVNVNIDGHPKKQIETKVKVIDELLEKIRLQREERALSSKSQKGGRKPAAQAKKKAGGEKNRVRR